MHSYKKYKTSLALSTCVFITLMQSVNGAQFLNITSLLLSFETAAVPVSATQSILAQSLVLNLGG